MASSVCNLFPTKGKNAIFLELNWFKKTIFVCIKLAVIEKTVL